MKTLQLGLFGFGVVGQGLYHVLNHNPGLRAEVRRICVKNRDKVRPLAPELFTFDPSDVLDDPEVQVVVELIDDAEAAYQLVTAAMRKGKHVVTANKKMLALNMPALLALQQETGVHLLYEASACGSIPIIRNLEEYYDNELLSQIRGIFNGSSNYILTKVCQEGQSYPEALAQAQALGFAESDPTLDVAGFDALYKLTILILHAFGQVLHPDQVFNAGIQHLHPADQQLAAEKGWRIKLVCQALQLGNQEMTAFVMPAFVESTDPLFTVNNEYNAVAVQAAFADQQFFQGKGAGGNPTGAAVLSDISALRYGYAYEYKKQQQANQLTYTTEVLLKVYLGYEDEAMLQHFDFWDVEARHQTADHSYLIGRVKLTDLVKVKQQLVHIPVFIALIPGAEVKPLAGLQ